MNRLRLATGWLLVLLLAASAAYSANFAGLRDQFPPPATRVAAAAGPSGDVRVPEAAGTGRRSFPWWQEVASFSGDEDTTTESFRIRDDALQWRVRWECVGAPLAIATLDAQGERFGHLLADAEECPDRGDGFSVQLGTVALQIEAGGPWRAYVEQQLDVPVVEPATTAMEAGEIVASGRFYGIDRSGEGKLIVYRLPNGSTALRLENFYVTPNVDLEIDLSMQAHPTTTGEFTADDRVRVSMLPVTTGDLNFEVPGNIEVERWRSVVIYCEPLDIAYAGATLRWEDRPS